MKRKYGPGPAMMAAGICGFVSVVAPAFAKPPPLAGTVNSFDKRFVTAAARGGLEEVALGQLAKDNGSKVKSFGARMISDHSGADAKLKGITVSKGIMSLPLDMDAKHEALQSRLKRLHGAAFDSAYIKAQREDHAATLALFQREVKNGSDPDIKHFAAQTIPTVKMHLSMLQNMNGKKGRAGRMKSASSAKM